LLQNWEHRQVGLFANACAAICCTQVGARAMGKRNEVISLIKSQRPEEAASF
jgi:sugar/nucleoside kinase (ribokinase family)